MSALIYLDLQPASDLRPGQMYEYVDHAGREDVVTVVSVEPSTLDGLGTFVQVQLDHPSLNRISGGSLAPGTLLQMVGPDPNFCRHPNANYGTCPDCGASLDDEDGITCEDEDEDEDAGIECEDEDAEDDEEDITVEDEDEGEEIVVEEAEPAAEDASEVDWDLLRFLGIEPEEALGDQDDDLLAFLGALSPNPTRTPKRAVKKPLGAATAKPKARRAVRS